MPLIDQVKSENTKSYINTRVMPQMSYYSSAGKKCKQQYRTVTAISIIISALVPVVSVFADGSIGMKAAIATLGSAATAIEAFLAIGNFKDLWYSYRSSREILLSTLHCYLHNSGIYAHLATQEERDLLLIETCEQVMMKESSHWKEVTKS